MCVCVCPAGLVFVVSVGWVWDGLGWDEDGVELRWGGDGVGCDGLGWGWYGMRMGWDGLGWGWNGLG